MSIKANTITNLEEWFCIHHEDGTPCLGGRVFGHPKYDPLTGEMTDGHRIITSKVVTVIQDQSLVQTQSGTYYKLGEPGTQEAWNAAIYSNFGEMISWDEFKELVNE